MSTRLEESPAYVAPDVSDGGEEVCIGAQRECGCIDLINDPLIRLVMESDGVSESETIEIMLRVRQALQRALHKN